MTDGSTMTEQEQGASRPLSIGGLIFAVAPFLRPWWPTLLGVAGLVLIEIAFTAALPMSLKFIIDNAIPQRDGPLLWSILAALAVAGVLVAVAGVWRDTLSARVTAQVIADIRERMFARLQQQSLDYFSRHQVGDLMSRFSGDLIAVERGLAAALPWGVIPLLDLLSHTVLLLFLDLELGLIALLVCPIIIAGPRVFAPRATAASAQRRVDEGQALSEIQENLAAQPTIKALSFQRPALERFMSRNQHVAESTRRVGMTGALVERSAGSGIVLMQVAITGIGAWRVFTGDMSLGDLVAFLALFATLAFSLSYLAQYAPNLFEAAGGMARVNEVLDAPRGVEDAPDAGTLPPFEREIRFDSVSFGYSDDKLDLHGVDLVIGAGENVAFIGPSGSGKSTVVNLLMRFFDPQQGAVRLDGHDVRGVTQHSLRAQIAIVFQDNFLFNVSLRENIRIGKQGASDAEVEVAARGAEIHDFIAALPEGYDTLAGERGGRLSGGQRQRIGIARALLRNPPVLILDEATSALDPATEASINATLERVARQRTVISVTHRLASVTGCDRIFVLKDGRLAESGRHDELLARQGLYAQLASKQHGFSISNDGGEASVSAERLRSIPVLSDLPQAQLEQLATQFALEEYPPGRLIFEKGDTGDRFYLIAHGSVEAYKGDVTERHARIAVMQDGDYFGELALIRKAPRNASVRTLTHCLMLTLTRGHFNHLLAQVPELQSRLLQRYLQD